MKTMSTADFKEHLRKLARGQTDDAIIGAPHAHPCVVRKPTDRGYYPPTRMVRCPDHRNGGATYCPSGGAALQMWQARQWGR